MKFRSLCWVVVTGLCWGGSGSIVCADDRLKAFFEREWEHCLEVRPTWAATLGRRDAAARWPDMSLAALEAEVARHQRVLIELEELTQTMKLTANDVLSVRLFRYDRKQAITRREHGLDLLVLMPRWGIHQADELASSLPFDEADHFQFWLALLQDFPRYVGNVTELLEEGMKNGVTQPAAVMERILDPMARHLVNNPEDSPFFKPFRLLPVAIPEEERERIRRSAKETIQTEVVPALRRFDRFFRERYLPACLPGPGAWRWPDGEQKYAVLAEQHTTTKLSPDEIHRIGLNEVKRLRGEIEKLKDQLPFRGTLEEFFTRLRTHPSFFYDTGPQLFGGYEKVMAKIEPRLSKLFQTFPKAQVVVESIPSRSAPNSSTAYYRPPAPDGSRPGAFTVNLHAPHMRPKWEMMALTLHESIPGHHFQIALAQQQEDLPEFRRHLSFTGYVEGWALYAEWLGHEMGLYDDPQDHLGQLVYDLWRSIRLVVDTGIHVRKWSRQQAIDYFLANAPKTELDVVNEVDRYITWPGQALAYKIGQMKILELRAEAEKALGVRFSLPAFHDAILLPGAVPLDVLEEEVRRWIAEQANE